MFLDSERFGRAYTYATAFFCGVSMLLPINAIFSAPLYVMNYYQYVMQDPDAVSVHKNFWDNSLTYYTMIVLVTSLIVEPLTLSKSFRRLPLRLRMLSALCILWLEIAVLMVVPAVGASEGGAIATIVIAGFTSALGKSVFETTAYGLFGAFPSRFMITLMGGIGVAGVLTSVLQLIVKAALPENYDGIRTQSKIFYGLVVGMHGVTFVLLALIQWVPFARRCTDSLSGAQHKTEDGKNAQTPKSNHDTSPDTEERDVVRDPHAGGDDDAGLLANTDILYVLKHVYPMLIACGFNFFVTLYLFPTIVVSVDSSDYWYGTVAVAIFNFTDVIGRFAPSLKCLWPARWMVVAASFARVIFIPLLLMSSYHYIPGFTFNYIMMVIFGLSNGFVGVLTLTFGPISEGLTTTGQRFVAGTMLGIAILTGGSIGTALSIMTQTLRE
ncbi:nucleobase transporter [Trypanosoma rangeli]|uniref:Nucleobase transporter n=1 Tax=Trypanosoma rangeli TaxID=5698 RepID=A0A422NR81_TRYRA|nr:nucleobase transporter [Trypanosoma rangeli]RNF07973.1 nucleobase transporter [Trypanosoma rangeli]|eukprot:RNF07973.1 nucleobase transporter [Trypanosoma rangeli]